MNKRPAIRDGLTRWNLEQVRRLYAHLLQRPGPEGRGRVDDHLRVKYQLVNLPRYVELIAVSCTPSGRSRFRYLKASPNVPLELEINHGHLDCYFGGGEYQEYQRYAADPVIGSRRVTNPDEALVMKLGHELAHLIVALSPAFDGQAPKPHGPEFQSVYRDVRAWAVNPWLDESAPKAEQAHERRLLRKLARLRAMADHSASNPHEAERALSQLNALMDRHQLHGLALEPSAHLQFVERIVPIFADGNYKPLMHLVWAIAQFAGVRAVTAGKDNVHGGQGSSQRALFFGDAVKVEMAVYLCEVLQRACVSDTQAYRASAAYRQDLGRGHAANSLLSSFRKSWTGQIKQRLIQQRWDRDEAIESDATQFALVQVQDQQLQEAFHRRFPRLGTARSATHQPIKSTGAHQAGTAAANRVNLNRPVPGTSIKRIGR